MDMSTGTRLLAFCATTGGLTTTGAMTATNTPLSLMRTGSRSQIREFHRQPPLPAPGESPCGSFPGQQADLHAQRSVAVYATPAPGLWLSDLLDSQLRS